MSITFRVSEVERARLPLGAPTGVAWEPLGSPVEAWGSSAACTLLGSQHGLLEAVSRAFSAHYPLVLTPDAIWLAIAQGFATYVKENAEHLRGKFVRHEGQEVILIRRDDFDKGSRENPWPEVFSAFSDEISARIGRQRDLVVCDFSTTGPCERAASEIVLMDAMQSYFSYDMCSLCGIPEITLEGTVDDWLSIRRRAQALEEYAPSWWLAGLLPVLDELVATATGQVDTAFWRSLFKLKDESGGPYVTGWINVLFPYLRADGAVRRNRTVSTWAEGLNQKEFGGGPIESTIPVGLSCVPFIWEHLGTRYSMELLGGFVGVAQDAETLALRPEIGWAVRDAVPLDSSSTTDLMYLSSGIQIYSTDGVALFAGRLPRDGVALFAGRISREDTVTLREVTKAARRAADFADRHDVFLEGALLSAANSLIEDAGRPGKLVVGVRLALLTPAMSSDDEDSVFVSFVGDPVHVSEDGDPAPVPVDSFERAFEKVSVLPASAWVEMDALVPGGLSSEASLHLGCFGDVEGALVFGEPVGDKDLRGIEVAAVSARGPCHIVIDASAAAHAARVAAAEAVGVASGSGAYYLRLRRGGSRGART